MNVSVRYRKKLQLGHSIVVHLVGKVFGSNHIKNNHEIMIEDVRLVAEKNLATARIHG